ncbi:MAG TPA: MOSC domain-containing protein [Phycisphaerae bacterium]
MKLMTLNIGRPHVVVRGGRQYSTAFDRRPAEGPVALTTEGLAGDRVSDQAVHGGADKALCCYPFEHYAFWGQQLGAELTVPSFGENLTTSGLLEAHVCIGDSFRIGSGIVQVSQPRQPCWKLALRHGEPRMIAWIHARGFTGFYVRVIQPGTLAGGEAIELLERPYPNLTVMALTRLRLSDTPDRAALGRLISISELSGSWRQHFSRRLNESGDGATNDE